MTRGGLAGCPAKDDRSPINGHRTRAMSATTCVFQGPRPDGREDEFGALHCRTRAAHSRTRTAHWLAPPTACVGGLPQRTLPPEHVRT